MYSAVRSIPCDGTSYQNVYRNEYIVQNLKLSWKDTDFTFTHR